MTEIAVPPWLYALVAAVMFLAFVSATLLAPSPQAVVGAGVAALAITSLMYWYLESVAADDFDPEEMFE